MNRISMILPAVALVLAGCASEPGGEVTRNVQGITSTDLNSYRADYGMSGLTYSKKLECAAARHVKDMTQRDFRSHTGSDGSAVGDRVSQAGFKWCHVSENITWGRATYAQAMQAWDASPGHKKNLLGRDARAYGVAQTNGVWVMVLAAPC